MCTLTVDKNKLVAFTTNRTRIARQGLVFLQNVHVSEAGTNVFF